MKNIKYHKFEKAVWEKGKNKCGFATYTQNVQKDSQYIQFTDEGNMYTTCTFGWSVLHTRLASTATGWISDSPCDLWPRRFLLLSFLISYQKGLIGVQADTPLFYSTATAANWVTSQLTNHDEKRSFPLWSAPFSQHPIWFTLSCLHYYSCLTNAVELLSVKRALLFCSERRLRCLCVCGWRNGLPFVSVLPSFFPCLPPWVALETWG